MRVYTLSYPASFFLSHIQSLIKYTFTIHKHWHPHTGHCAGCLQREIFGGNKARDQFLKSTLAFFLLLSRSPLLSLDVLLSLSFNAFPRFHLFQRFPSFSSPNINFLFFNHTFLHPPFFPSKRENKGMRGVVWRIY